MAGRRFGIVLASSLLALAVAAPAAAAGTKKIRNDTAVTLKVTIYGRNGSVHDNLPPVSALIPPGGARHLHYGDMRNPYMNVLVVGENSQGSNVIQAFKTTATGGPGTLDNLFNTNDTLVIGYSGSTYSYTLEGHN